MPIMPIHIFQPCNKLHETKQYFVFRCTRDGAVKRCYVFCCNIHVDDIITPEEEIFWPTRFTITRMSEQTAITYTQAHQNDQSLTEKIGSTMAQKPQTNVNDVKKKLDKKEKIPTTSSRNVSHTLFPSNGICTICTS